MTLNVGLIGCGKISATYLSLAPLFADIRIVAIADQNEQLALDRAREFDVKARLTGDLLASDDIDIVVNLTVPDAHYDVTRRILEAGKHAYTEKPLALTMKQAAGLTGLTATTGRRIGAAPDTFLGGAHQQARALVDGGSIGKITSVVASFMSPGMESWHPDPGFLYQPGGGPVLDMAPYHLTNLVQLIGPVQRVTALTTTPRQQRTITSPPKNGEVIDVKTPTTVHALLQFVSGATATLICSWDVHGHTVPFMELYGTDGSLTLADPNHFGGTLLRTEGGGQRTPVPDWDHPFGQPNWELDSADPRANYRAAGLADMAAAIIADKPHRCALDLAVHVTEVVTSILKSGQQGKVIEMTTTCDRPAPLGPDDARKLMETPK